MRDFGLRILDYIYHEGHEESRRFDKCIIPLVHFVLFVVKKSYRAQPLPCALRHAPCAMRYAPCGINAESDK